MVHICVVKVHPVPTVFQNFCHIGIGFDFNFGINSFYNCMFPEFTFFEYTSLQN